MWLCVGVWVRLHWGVPCICHQVFFLIPLCIVQCSLCGGICTCKWFHSWLVWGPCPWVPLVVVWLCLCPWSEPGCLVCCKSFSTFLPNPVFMVWLWKCSCLLVHCCYPCCCHWFAPLLVCCCYCGCVFAETVVVTCLGPSWGIGIPWLPCWVFQFLVYITVTPLHTSKSPLYLHPHIYSTIFGKYQCFISLTFSLGSDEEATVWWLWKLVW